MRLISKAHYLANTSLLFSKLKVLDIYSINSFSVATFVYSYHHNLLPSSFRNLFLSSNQVHHYETRLKPLSLVLSFVDLTLSSSVSFIESQQFGILCQLHFHLLPHICDYLIYSRSVD